MVPRDGRPARHRNHPCRGPCVSLRTGQARFRAPRLRVLHRARRRRHTSAHSPRRNVQPRKPRCRPGRGRRDQARGKWTQIRSPSKSSSLLLCRRRWPPTDPRQRRGSPRIRGVSPLVAAFPLTRTSPLDVTRRPAWSVAPSRRFPDTASLSTSTQARQHPASSGRRFYRTKTPSSAPCGSRTTAGWPRTVCWVTVAV